MFVVCLEYGWILWKLIDNYCVKKIKDFFGEFVRDFFGSWFIGKVMEGKVVL